MYSLYHMCTPMFACTCATLILLSSSVFSLSFSYINIRDVTGTKTSITNGYEDLENPVVPVFHKYHWYIIHRAIQRKVHRDYQSTVLLRWQPFFIYFFLVQFSNSLQSQRNIPHSGKQEGERVLLFGPLTN